MYYKVIYVLYDQIWNNLRFVFRRYSSFARSVDMQRYTERTRILVYQLNITFEEHGEDDDDDNGSDWNITMDIIREVLMIRSLPEFIFMLTVFACQYTGMSVHDGLHVKAWVTGLTYLACRIGDPGTFSSDTRSTTVLKILTTTMLTIIVIFNTIKGNICNNLIWCIRFWFIVYSNFSSSIH